MPLSGPKTPEQFAMTALMEQVEQTLCTLMNGAPGKKSPWHFALVAHHDGNQAMAFLSSDKEPRKAAAMMLDMAMRIGDLSDEDIAEVQRRARRKAN